jgi:hypothetical protein
VLPKVRRGGKERKTGGMFGALTYTSSTGGDCGGDAVGLPADSPTDFAVLPGATSRGRPSHAHAPLYTSFVVLHTDQARAAGK